MDQAADAGDHEDHHRRQRVDGECDVDVKAADVDPGEKVGQQPGDTVLGLEPEELHEGDEGEDERQRDGAARDEPDRSLPEAPLERRTAEPEHGRPDERRERDERHVAGGDRRVRHPRSRSVASTSIVSNRW